MDEADQKRRKVMKKIGILGFIMLLVFVLFSGAFSIQRAGQVIGVGAGLYAGTAGISADMLLRIPEARFNTKDLYLRVGLALTDSQNLTPDQAWRRFIPLYTDLIYYYADDAYVGAGLNLPLKVSDNETGEIGGQLFLGSDLRLDFLGKIYGEVGYSTLNMLGKKSFAGLYLTVGWRYNLI